MTDTRVESRSSSWFSRSSQVNQKFSIGELGNRIHTHVQNNWDVLTFNVTSLAAGMSAFPGFGAALGAGVVIGLVHLLSLPTDQRDNARLSRWQILALATLQIVLAVLNWIVSTQGIPAPVFRQVSSYTLGLVAGLGGMLRPRR